ncbi:hypothetical protein [Janthinobacterium sp.]|uniref:hypothetical protein n=1 Tax=Janthinobacterium sp. TaxID=1871054 RepID=UPI00293D3471|nr:hypothetical protein [Janthinobacterium sp.]
MKKFTALHVSDLHLSRARERDQQMALCALYKDIADYRDAGNPIDAIFFSGELLARGEAGDTPPTYIYTHFIEPLLAAASGPDTRFSLLPRSRARDGAARDGDGGAGFSFFSSRGRADAEQRAVYQNVHALFHGHRRSGDTATLPHALGVLFDARVALRERVDANFHGYSVLEFRGAPAPHWSVTLRRYSDARQDFALAARYTEHGRESFPSDVAAPVAAAPVRFARQLLSHGTSALAPGGLAEIFVEPPLSNLGGRLERDSMRSQSRLLHELAENERAVFFVGREESGKTTLLSYLCLRAQPGRAFLIDLRALGTPSRAALLAAAARSGGQDTAGVAATLLRRGALLCCDNLTLADAGALAVLAAFMDEFEACKFCFTLAEGLEKTLHGALLAQLARPADIVYLHSFGAAQARQLARNWCGGAFDALSGRYDAALGAMARLDLPRTPFLLSIALSLAERGLPCAAANRAEMIAAYTASLLGTTEAGALQRDFLIELAYHLFESKAPAMRRSALRQFEADYFDVKGLRMPLVGPLEALCARGLLLETDGEIAFKYESFRTFFLAQKFDTSLDLMRYAFTQKGFMELQPELDIYTGLHRDAIEVLTGADRPPDAAAPRPQSTVSDLGSYAERYHGGELTLRHSTDQEESLILDVAKNARIQRRSRLADAACGDA